MPTERTAVSTLFPSKVLGYYIAAVVGPGRSVAMQSPLHSTRHAICNAIAPRVLQYTPRRHCHELIVVGLSMLTRPTSTVRFCYLCPSTTELLSYYLIEQSALTAIIHTSAVACLVVMV